MPTGQEQNSHKTPCNRCIEWKKRAGKAYNARWQTKKKNTAYLSKCICGERNSGNV